MSRYDGLIIPRSYSEYINKTDAATLQQALQLSGVLSEAVAAGDNKAVKSSAVNAALTNYCIFTSGYGLKCNYTKLNGLVNAHFAYISTEEQPAWTSFFALPLPINKGGIIFKIGNETNNYNMYLLGASGIVQNETVLPAGQYYGYVSYEHA